MKIKFQNLIGENTKYITRFLKEYKLYNNVINNLNKDVISRCKYINNYNSLITTITFIAYGNKYTLIDKINLSKNFEKFYFKMKYNKTKEELFDTFLKQNKLYTKFYNNTKILKPFIEESQTYHNKLSTMINDAFEWEKTNEGAKFWTNAHKKLVEYEKYLLGYKNEYICNKSIT